MFVSQLLGGLLVGLPLMLAVGPIAVLLLDQGLERGVRAATPAALGVASADLSFSAVAAVAGASAATALRPITPWLSLGAVALLAGLAVRMFRTSIAELRVRRAVPAASAPVLAATGALAVSPVVELVPGATDLPAVDDGALDRGALDSGALGCGAGSVPREVTFASLRGLRLSAAFYGLTLVNPLTVVMFVAVVVAGGAGVGTPGWVLGMGLASLLVHG
ncbi:MAG: LysE family transporter, partial [Microthrixaceae bacterium]